MDIIFVSNNPRILGALNGSVCLLRTLRQPVMLHKRVAPFLWNL
jgi:hypothetical protein